MPVVKELTDLLREQRRALCPRTPLFIFPTKPAKGSAGRAQKGWGGDAQHA